MDTPEIRPADVLERAGRRSAHGSSADAWEQREREAHDVEVGRALALLPPELQRRIADPSRVIEPLVIAEQARKMEESFQALCTAVLKPEDYAWYEVSEQANQNGRIVEVKVLKQRKRKSAWRKLARYFNVDVETTREVIGHRHVEATCARIMLAKHNLTLGEGEDCGCPTTYARYHVKVLGANGRVGFGVGIASTNERGFKAQDHSVPATAYTRAVSRGISDMIGAGEGEASDPVETTDADKGEQPAKEVRPAITEGKPLTDAQQEAYQRAWRGASADQRRNAIRYLSDRGYEPGQFTAYGSVDLNVVMDYLGAGVPEEAPL